MKIFTLLFLAVSTYLPIQNVNASTAPNLPGISCDLLVNFDNWSLYFDKSKAGFFDNDSTTLASFEKQSNGELTYKSTVSNDPFNITVKLPNDLNNNSVFSAYLNLPFDIDFSIEADPIQGDNKSRLEFTCKLNSSIELD